MELIDYIKNNILIFDGAMGTMLQQNGLKIGENTEVFGFENSDKLLKIMYEEKRALSNIVDNYSAAEKRFNTISRKMANQTNGVFFLRIEDTDQKREVENATKGIVESLKDF